MPFCKNSGSYALCDARDLSIQNTFECGQCFRFVRNDDRSYSCIAASHAARLFEERGTVYIETREHSLPFFRQYFDLSRDYGAITSRFARDDFMSACLDFGSGLRILRQEPWEALCSFILSQCNNIPRIKAIIASLCAHFGADIPGAAESLRAFPSPQSLAPLTVSDLAPIRSGYRANYVIEAARAVASGAIDFTSLESLDTERARKTVMRIPGVGAKVADCFLLFGLHKLDAFPVDTWMKKAQGFYPAANEPSSFGAYAGVAQQYIFYYARAQKLTK